MSEDMDTADVLDAAADYLRTFGWTQKQFGSCGGPMCASGAIFSVTQLHGEWQQPAIKALEVAIDHMWVPHWNDYRHRTADKVITALMEAAARVRLGEIKP